MRFTFVILCLALSVSVHAGQFQLHLHHTAWGEYGAPSLGDTYTGRGYGLGVDYFFRNTTGGTQLVGSSGLVFNWGLGLSYSDLCLTRQDNVGASVLLASEFDWSLYRVGPILSWTYGAFRIELPLQFSLGQEKSSFNEGDEKYGFAYGLRAFYLLSSRFSVGLSYEQMKFDHGKNASTDKSGSLTNSVESSLLFLELSYTIPLGSGGVY